MTSTDLATQQPNRSLGEKMEYAKALATADLLPRSFRDKPGNVLLAVEMGDSLNIPTIQAINSIHVIEGKPSASAALISALVRRAGHKLRVTGDDKSATATIIRADDPGFEYKSVWTLERARTAGLLGKGVWKAYPAAMMKARAITEVARDACQEALMGVQYTPEELGANVDSDGDPVVIEVGTPIRDTQPTQRDGKQNVLDQVERATTVDEVRELWKASHGQSWFDADLQSVLSQAAQRLADPANDASATSGEPGEGDEVVDAELVDDAPTEQASKPQLAKIGALFRDCGWQQRDDQLRAVRAITRRPEVQSRSDLTKADAHAVIEVLTFCVEQDDPPMALSDMVASAGDA